MSCRASSLIFFSLSLGWSTCKGHVILHPDLAATMMHGGAVWQSQWQGFDLAALSACLLNPQQSIFSAANKPLTLQNRVHDGLFQDPEHWQLQLSHDGKQVAMLEHRIQGQQLSVVGVDKTIKSKVVIEAEQGRQIALYGWCFNQDYLWFLQDQSGDENYHLHVVCLKTGEVIDLTPLNGVSVKFLQHSPKHPDWILVQINQRDPRFHDVFKVNLITGVSQCVERNSQFVDFIANQDLELRIAVGWDEQGNKLVYHKSEASVGWQELFAVTVEDAITTSPLFLSQDARYLYLMDSRDQDTAALTMLDLVTGQLHKIGDDCKADLAAWVYEPKTLHVQAACFTYLMDEWQFFDVQFAQHFAGLQKRCGGQVRIVSRSLDDTVWLVRSATDLGRIIYLLFYPAIDQYKFLGSQTLATDIVQPVPMHPQIITARDGLPMVSYLSLPTSAVTGLADRPNEPIPMVLLVHGGPQSRDVWEYNCLHQHLAGLGIAVLSVNFRGSTGFGKNFIAAGYGQWAAKIQDDLVDAVKWAIEQKIALPNKIAIMGTSFGGYSALMGLARTPDIFACGVDICGPSNLQTMLEGIPAYWRPAVVAMYHSLGIGFKIKPEDISFLQQASPDRYLINVNKPLFIAHGSNDVRVRQSESDATFRYLKSGNIPVTYIVFPDEGHGCKKPANQRALLLLVEQFLAHHLLGESRSLDDADLYGSSVRVIREL